MLCVVLALVLNATLDEGRVAMAFLVLLGFNVVFAIIAACLIGYKVREKERESICLHLIIVVSIFM